MLANVLYSVFLCLVCFSFGLALDTESSIGKSSVSASFKPAKPSAAQAQWLDFEVGASIHFNMQTFDKNMKRGRLICQE
jgi:hypothetical protein